MKKVIVAIILLLAFARFEHLLAQWAKIYGTSEEDNAHLIQQTSDGGYIVAGTILNIQEKKLWILKLGGEGAIEWQKSYRWGYSTHLSPLSVQQTDDGGYIIGFNEIYFGSYDIWILKLDPSGELDLTRSFGKNAWNYANSLQPANDGGWILAGTYRWSDYNYEAWASKLTPSGEIEWEWFYGGSENESARSVQQTQEGGYIMAGETSSFGAGGKDIWILKLSAAGHVEWQRAYGRNEDDSASRVQQTGDGGYVVAASTRSFGAGEEDIWILKFPPLGKLSGREHMEELIKTLLMPSSKHKTEGTSSEAAPVPLAPEKKIAGF